MLKEGASNGDKLCGASKYRSKYKVATTVLPPGEYILVYFCVNFYAAVFSISELLKVRFTNILIQLTV